MPMLCKAGLHLVGFKPGKQASSNNWNKLDSVVKTTEKTGQRKLFEFCNTRNETRIIAKEIVDFSAIVSHFYDEKSLTL
jgi:hypothetical protein